MADREFFPSPKNGMPLKYWMAHYGKEFDGKAGLYLISVYLKSYARFSKVGLATNLKTRFFLLPNGMVAYHGPCPNPRRVAKKSGPDPKE